MMKSPGNVLMRVAAMACLAGFGMAQAQPAPVTPERVSKITVSPLVADPGVLRQITVEGKWPGCQPVIAGGVDRFYLNNRTRAVQLALPYPPPPCPLGYVSYSLSFSFTPTERGTYTLIITGQDSEFLAETQVDVRGVEETHSAFNIGGMWYDPQSNGSGLTFVHSRNSDNAVFGTWYVYDASGKPRWYTIQDATWKSQGLVMEGTLYETATVLVDQVGTLPSCPAPFTACPAPSGRLTAAGRFRLTLTAAASALTVTGAASARAEALAADGSVKFFSNVIRAEF